LLKELSFASLDLDLHLDLSLDLYLSFS